MDTENSTGMMEHNIRGNSRITSYRGKENINGKMSVCMLGDGRTIKWRVKEYVRYLVRYSVGRMVGDTLGSIRMIAKMDMGNSIGLMAGYC